MSTPELDPPGVIYTFGPFRLDPQQGLLLREDEPIALTRKVFETLLVLVENAGRVLTREELMERIWPDTIVTDTNLTQNIWVLRKALEGDSEGVRYVETLPRRGYRFVAPVERVAVYGRAPLMRDVVPPPAELPAAGVAVPQTDAPPPDRFRVVGAILAGVAILAVIAALVISRRNAEPARTSQFTTTAAAVKLRPALVTTEFHDETGDDDHWLRAALPRMIADEVAATERLRVLPGESAARMQRDLALPAADAFAKTTLDRIRDYSGADLVLSGAFLEIGSGEAAQLRFTARVQDVQTGVVLASISESGTATEIFSMVRNAGDQLRRGLKLAPPEPQVAEARVPAPPNVEVAKLLSIATAAMLRGTYPPALEAAEKARDLAPGYGSTHRLLADILWRMGYVTRSREAAQKALALSKTLPRSEQLQIEALEAQTRGDRKRVAEVREALWRFYPENIDYGLDYGNALCNASRADEVPALLAQLRKLPPPSGTDPRMGIVEANAMVVTGDFRKAAVAADKAATELRRIGAKALLSRALFYRAVAARELDEPNQLAILDECLKVSREGGSYSGEIRTHIAMAQVLARADRNEEALKMLDETILTARRVGDLNGQVAATGDSAGVLLELRRFDDAQKRYEATLALAREIDDKTNQATVLSNLGEFYFASGALREARKNVDLSLAIARERKLGGVITSALINSAAVALESGDLARARRDAEEAVKFAESGGRPRKIASAQRVLADVIAAAGDVARARQTLDAAATKLGPKDSYGNVLRAGIAVLDAATGKAAAVPPPSDNLTQTLLSARALAISGKAKEARAEAERAVAKVASTPDGAPERIAANAVRLLAIAAGSRSEAAAALPQLRAIAADAERRGLRAHAFDARLAHCRASHLAAAPGWQEGCRALSASALKSGYTFVAQQATREAGR